MRLCLTSMPLALTANLTEARISDVNLLRRNMKMELIVVELEISFFWVLNGPAGTVDGC